MFLTTEQKLNLIFKGCDKIVDEAAGVYPQDALEDYEQGQRDLAQEILNILEGD